MSDNSSHPISLESIKLIGHSVLEILRAFHPSFDYDDSSIEWLNDYIQQNRDLFPEAKRDVYAVGIGYILGETLIRTVGGRWGYDSGQQQWIVTLAPPVGQANPIGKAFKYLGDYSEGIASMLRVVRLVAEKGGWDKIDSSDDERDTNTNGA